MNEAEVLTLIKEELEKRNEVICRGDIKTLMQLTKRGRNFCLEIFWKFRKELDSRSGGFVVYPQAGVKGYNFDIDKMKVWIKYNEKNIF
ncbi:DUF771 domain-containing protein [Vagococcus salmoninarum]|uniref:DUF771 domain-containing protein n=1 Tax=Vagococcus salmoninarum TaxID=2739 RepID=UPI0028D2954F|nr:DUF771 domain-containing protein [Vagococcus salmoninarum]